MLSLGRIFFIFPGDQSVWTKSSWAETEKAIQEGYSKKKIITGICYNSGQASYMVVMTQSSSEQFYKWFGPNEGTERKKWIDKQFEEKKYPTIMFNDPSNEKHLVVVTSDSNRSNYKFMSGFRLTAEITQSVTKNLQENSQDQAT